MTQRKFRSIEECLHALPSKELTVTVFLRNLILDSIPTCHEKLSYNVPYYSGNQTICFIWPGSVLWGDKRMYDGVRLGFTKGHLLSNDLNYFEKGSRKFVIYKDFQSISDIDTDIVKLYLFEAAEIDHQLSKSTKTK